MPANGWRRGRKRRRLPEANRLDVVVTAGNLLTAVAALEGWGYLSAITGLDQGAEAGSMEVLYHFCSGAVSRDAAGEHRRASRPPCRAFAA